MQSNKTKIIKYFNPIQFKFIFNLAALAIIIAASFLLFSLAFNQKYPLETVIQVGHSHFINSVAFSPDGKYILTGSSDWTVKLWDAATKKLIRNFVGHTGKITSVDFISGDGSIVTSENNEAKQWEVMTGHLIKSHITYFNDMKYDNSKKYEVDSPYIFQKISEFNNRKEIKNLPSGNSKISFWTIFSPDKKYLVNTFEDNVKFWDMSKGGIVKTYSGFSEPVRTITFSPDSKYVVIQEKLFEVATWKEIIFPDKSLSFAQSQFSPDSKYITAARNVEKLPYELVLLEILDGKKIKIFSGYCGHLIHFSPDGKYLGFGEKLFEVSTGKEMHRFPKQIIKAFDPSSKYVVTARTYPKLYEISSGKEIKSFEGSYDDEQIPDYIDIIKDNVNFSLDGKYMLTAGGRAPKLWEVETEKVIERYKTGKQYLPPKFTPDTQYIISGANMIKLCEVPTGKEILNLTGHASPVNSVDMDHDRNIIITNSLDMTTKFWDLQTGKEIATLVYIGKNDWILKTPDGYFDCTKGAKQSIHFVRGMKVFDYDRYASKFYHPSLWGEIINR